ncbi:hypothetical protein Aperf_G00000036445 [Anoplocephala perfoliata]
MNSNFIDPGLFDTPIPSTSARPGSATSSQIQNTRRIYRPVPEEKRRSVEYRVSRQRNNQAVQRCRANNKVRQDSMRIKAEGYRALQKCFKAEAVVKQNYLERLRELIYMQINTRQEFGDQLQTLLDEENARRVDFEANVERIRQMYAEKVQAVIDGGQAPASTTPDSTLNDALSKLSPSRSSSLSSSLPSDPSLKTQDPISDFSFSPTSQ